MKSDFFDELENIDYHMYFGENENDIRDGFQSLFDGIAENGGDFACGEKYLAALSALKKYCNRLYSSEEYIAEPETVNIGDIIEAVVFCCDILCAEWKKRIFLLDRPLVKVSINGKKLLIWALIELIANAVVYSRDKYIGVSASINGEKLIIKVENIGEFKEQDFCEAISGNGGGLKCVAEISKKLGGTLLMSNGNISGRATTNMLFAIGVSSADNKKSTDNLKCVNDYISLLLNDRLSPVYVCMSELL